MFETIILFLAFGFIIHYFNYILYHVIYTTSNISNMQSDAKFIKKKFKSLFLEPHSHDCSIIVHYKLEAAVYGDKDMADPMLATDKKDCQRIIRLKTLNPKTDVGALAREVVEKCDLIHSTQLSEVEQIIYFLKNRKNSSNLKTTVRSKSEARILDKIPIQNDESCSSIRRIEEYIDLLYEELPDRILGSSSILQLARNPDNLEELKKNEAVLSALSRVLREDWRKNVDLCTNIIYTFFCFSTYSRFHAVIITYKIGSLCMDIIENEIKKYDQMKMEIDRRKNLETNKNISDYHQDNIEASIMNIEKPKEMEPPRRRIPELKQRPKSGNWTNMSLSASTSLLKNSSMNNSYHEGLSKELYCFSSGNISIEDDKYDSKNQKDEMEKLNRQFKTFAKKQEQLLRVSFYLLLNIAENNKLEEKMRKKSIIRMLNSTLERQNIDLLILVITFLKKLSIVKDNKEEMKDLNVVEKLPRLLQSSNHDLILTTLKLIFNLSFDGQIRSKMIRNQMFTKIIQFMSDDKYHAIVIRILYHFSLDDKVKPFFATTDCIPLLMDMLVLNVNKKSETDLVALGINLALNKKCAQKMIEHNKNAVIQRAFKYQDELLMKMIRNLSFHDELKKDFLEYINLFAIAIVQDVPANSNFKIECLIALGNMTLQEIDFSQLMQSHNLLSWIKDALTSGKEKDDMVLQIIIFLSTSATYDELNAMLLCKAGVILALIELLKAKQEDDEIVLQIIFMFQQLLKTECTRNYMIKETETPAYLIDLMHDKNIEIRRICDYCLDIIAIVDTNWATRIKLEKFRNHNSQWLTMVETQETNYVLNNDSPDNEEVDMPVYYASEHLTQMYQSDESNQDSNKYFQFDLADFCSQ